MGNNAPRLLIGGVSSGCGKTTVVSALLRALQRRGIPLSAFKCGPDYIDPMFHEAVLHVPSRNLDLFFVEEEACRAQLARCIPLDGCGVIEGVMGFYDGVSGTTEQASAAHLARATGTPAVLVVNPQGQSLSLAAMLQGFRDFRENTLQGVIVNGISERMYPFYREIIAQSGLHPLGFLPRVPASEIPDRHLGLVTATEIGDLQRRLDLLADAALQSLDLDGLLALARTAKPLAEEETPLAPVCRTPVRIAVAQDRAFCFYYADNFDVLRALGAEMIPFSPLEDDALPENVQGLYLGGGYPELYTARLSQNRVLREEIAARIQNGLPTIAECGGFMYLHETLCGQEGAAFPMVGVIPGAARMTDRLQRFGYVTLTAQRDQLLCRKGEHIRAHEFHYGVSDDMGDSFLAEKPDGRAWPCVYASQTLYAGYPHLYFRAKPSIAARFVRRCAGENEGSSV